MALGNAARLFGVLTALTVISSAVLSVSEVPGADAASDGRPSAGTAKTTAPDVVTEFDTSAAGGGARPLLGDVTGDGRLDIVMMQPHYVESDQYEGALVAALTAYNLEGKRLWQAGEVDPRGRNNGSDIPAQIYDLDNDGHNEVVAIMHPHGDKSAEGRFMIFNGRTGELERSFALPHPEAHDAIIFANLTGKETAQEILLKDRYEQVWALNSDGKVLWTHRGNTGHYPWPYDFNGDGRQEIMIGYDMVSPDGEVLWSAELPAHADTMWMADVNADGQTDVVLGGSGTTALDASGGDVIWQNNDTVESQNVMVGDYLPELEGLETLGLDRIDRSENGYDGLFLLDHNGDLVWKEKRETRGCWGSIPEPIHNWTGDYHDLIMVWNRGCGEPTGIMNGAGDLVAELDYGARLWHADFCGDDREEVIEYVQGESVRIVSNGPCDLDAKITGDPLPQAKRLYNYTRYTAGETPVLLSGDAAARASSEQGAHGVSRLTDGTRRGWRAAGKEPGEWVQIDLGRTHTLTGLRLDMKSHPAAQGRFTYRVEVSDDGRRWSTATEAEIDAATGQEEQLFTAQGRYVRLTFTGLPDSPRARAHLAELKVFGNN